LKKKKLSLFTRDKRPTAFKGKEAFIKNDLICKTLRMTLFARPYLHDLTETWLSFSIKKMKHVLLLI